MARSKSGKRIELTDRDFAIFQLLCRYRYLRSTHLFALVGGKSQKRFIERLGHLYHEGGFLLRPGQQWHALNARYSPVVYELGPAGQRALAERGLFVDEAGGAVSRSFLGAGRQYLHELLLCDLMASIEIGIRVTPRLRLISWREILASAKMPEDIRVSRNPLSVPVSVSYTCPRSRRTYRSDRPLVPDAVFGIEYTIGEQRRFRFFAVEADRTTEPISRGNLTQTSYLRKMLQYQEVVTRSLYKEHWGLPNLLVLNVTISRTHQHNTMRRLDEIMDKQEMPYMLFKVMLTGQCMGCAPAADGRLLLEPWERAALPAVDISRP